MTPEQLKVSILQYAIQGKLVEQRQEEGTAEVLYQKIQEEKQKLIKEGKIKKEKPLPAISENEFPFDIPETWLWCYVGDLFNHNTGKAMNSSAKKVDKSGAIRPFITTSNVYWNRFDFSSVKEMFFSDDEVERCTVTKGDILMCEGGAYFGRTAIWNYDYDICFQNHVHRLRPYQEIDLMFFYHVFFFYKSMNMMKAKGTAMPGLSSITLHQMIIPLPPLAEQKRIVSKIEELLPIVERYTVAYDKLEKFNARFPEDMKKSILQYAIQGKLVEQRVGDGTGEEQYKQIQDEKKMLINEGIIKKEKPLLEITDDEIPFDIPESWKWCRLGTLTYNWGQKTPDSRFCYVDVGSVNNNANTLNDENTIIEAKDASSRARKIVKYGDVIFATIRPYLKNICIIDREFPYEPIVSTAFAVMHCPEGLFNKYLYYYLLSPTFMSFANASDKAKGVAYPAIGEKDFFNGIIALPPFEEQKRIVAKIEELLPYCDRLVKQ